MRQSQLLSVLFILAWLQYKIVKHKKEPDHLTNKGLLSIKINPLIYYPALSSFTFQFFAKICSLRILAAIVVSSFEFERQQRSKVDGYRSDEDNFINIV